MKGGAPCFLRELLDALQQRELRCCYLLLASNSILLPLSQGGARLDKLLGQVHDLLPDPTLPDGVGVVVGPTKTCDAAHTRTAARLTAVALALGSLRVQGLTRLRRGTHEHSRAPHCRRPRSRFSHSHALQAYNAPAVPKRATQRHTHASCTGYSLCLSRRAQLPLSSH